MDPDPDSDPLHWQLCNLFLFFVAYSWWRRRWWWRRAAGSPRPGSLLLAKSGNLISMLCLSRYWRLFSLIITVAGVAKPVLFWLAPALGFLFFYWLWFLLMKIRLKSSTKIFWSSHLDTGSGCDQNYRLWLRNTDGGCLWCASDESIVFWNGSGSWLRINYRFGCLYMYIPDLLCWLRLRYPWMRMRRASITLV